MVYKTFIESVFFFIVLISCAGQQNKTVVLKIGEHRIVAEVADTPEKTQKGLMFRKKLAPDHGMLFVFTTEDIRGFWMKNTSIPLSIAYIDYEGKIREIYDLRPHNLDPITSIYPFRYALEMNKGYFDKMGIRVGDMVDLSVLADL